MEESQNGSRQDRDDAVIRASVYEFDRIADDSVIRVCVNKLFNRVSRHFHDQSARGIILEGSLQATDVSQPDRENVQHLISSVVFRCFSDDDGDQWEVDDVWDNVDITRLHHIQLAGNYEMHIDQLDDNGEAVNARNAMIENPNVVLLRDITDWSRDDGNVWSQQVIWSGSFTECQRIVQLFDEASSNSASSSVLQVMSEHFDLHLDLRKEFIYCHDTYPVAASISAVESLPTVIISEELVGLDDPEGVICVICHDILAIGEPVRQLPCKHVFHGDCLYRWFYHQLQCPLCRYQLDSSAS